jgi:putative membrane protein (TIGR04086 family)
MELHMKINWKRVVIAAIWSELLLMAIYFPAKMYSVPGFPAIAILAMLGSMFLGGLWAVRKVESHFVLHGLLVGIIANVVFYVPLLVLMPIFWPNESIGGLIEHIFAAAIKILGAAIGGYVGGRLREKSTA